MLTCLGNFDLSWDPAMAASALGVLLGQGVHGFRNFDLADVRAG